MPFADDSVIDQLEQRLNSMKSVTTLLSEGNTPEQLLEYILGDMDLEVLDTQETRFICNCDKDRVEKVLISLGRDELKDIINDGEGIDINCHFCNKNYHFSIEELKAIMARCNGKK